MDHSLSALLLCGSLVAFVGTVPLSFAWRPVADLVLRALSAANPPLETTDTPESAEDKERLAEALMRAHP